MSHLLLQNVTYHSIVTELVLIILFGYIATLLVVFARNEENCEMEPITFK